MVGLWSGSGTREIDAASSHLNVLRRNPCRNDGRRPSTHEDESEPREIGALSHCGKKLLKAPINKVMKQKLKQIRDRICPDARRAYTAEPSHGIQPMPIAAPRPFTVASK